MAESRQVPPIRFLFAAVGLLILCGCSPLAKESVPRFFWPPPPAEARIEYINFYYSDEDTQRGVNRRVEEAILGRNPPQRVIYKPFSVASDGHGRFFVVDFSGPTIHVFDLRQHEYRKFGTEITTPQKVLVDSAGEIWVLDSRKGILYHFDANEKILGEITLPEIKDAAASFAVDRLRQRIYFADSKQHQLRLYDLTGRFLESWGGRGSKPGEFNFPGEIDLDAEGNVYVVDAMNARIQRLSPDGTVVGTFGERGTASGSFSIPKGIAVSPGGLVYVSDATQHKIVIFSREGDYLLTLGARFVFTGTEISPGGFNFPAGMDVDANETLWVTDLLNGMVHEFQYLTPEFLAKRPIREEEIYRPQASDYQQGEDEAILPPPTE